VRRDDVAAILRQRLVELGKGTRGRERRRRFGRRLGPVQSGQRREEDRVHSRLDLVGRLQTRSRLYRRLRRDELARFEAVRARIDRGHQIRRLGRRLDPGQLRAAESGHLAVVARVDLRPRRRVGAGQRDVEIQKLRGIGVLAALLRLGGVSDVFGVRGLGEGLLGRRDWFGRTRRLGHGRGLRQCAEQGVDLVVAGIGLENALVPSARRRGITLASGDVAEVSQRDQVFGIER
jgi:hypothetical protein